MTKRLLTTVPAAKQKSNVLNKGTNSLLRRFLLVRKISLLLLLITIALLLTFILVFYSINSLNSLNDALFALRLLPFALRLLPIAFIIIIRLIYRWLKDTNVPLYVIALISILPVVGAIYLDCVVNDHGMFYFLVIGAKILVALKVFALALFLTGLGHLCYQVVIMTKHRRKFSALMFVSTVVAAILLTTVVVAVVMRVARGKDFFFATFERCLMCLCHHTCGTIY